MQAADMTDAIPAMPDATLAEQRMSETSARLRELIARHAPDDILSLVWLCLLFLNSGLEAEESGASLAPSATQEGLQLVAEYAHAVWSAEPPASSYARLESENVDAILAAANELFGTTMIYCMASSLGDASGPFGEMTRDVEYHAKNSWVAIRGHRYQTLEAEFFAYVLGPHDEALVRAYGVDGRAIAQGVQAAVDAMRRGMPQAFLKLREAHERFKSLVADTDGALDEALARVNAASGGDLAGSMLDIFKGGVCNLSRHSGLPATLLSDLAYERGTHQEFFAEGPLSGTPMLTLPGRIRPLIRLGEDYFATDPQFVRDSTYRALQRGLLVREPDYRQPWGKRQAAMCEDAFGYIFGSQLANAEMPQSIYFRDLDSGQWVESDVLILLDDAMIQIEAKAGVTAMQSPATGFSSHVRAIQDLVVKAYRQSKRFLRYLASAEEVALYRLEGGIYSEVRKVRLSDYRTVLPIGLTVESFTPFSAMCKELPEIEPILGRFPFISMSVDDLFVLTKILPAAGQLFHYLEVRQALAGEKRVMLFDELDHLGAYVSNNRFDMTVLDMIEKDGADRVMATAYSEVIDDYFAVDDWAKSPPPGQKMPQHYQAVLTALEHTAAPGWLRGDSFLRNLGGDSRKTLDDHLRAAIKRLRRQPMARFILSGEQDVVVSVCPHRGEGDPDAPDRARSLALAMDKDGSYAIEVRIKPSGIISQAHASWIIRPTPDNPEFARLERDAGKLRMHIAREDLSALG